MPKMYRGRMIDHVHLVVHDLEASFKFYSAIMKVLGVENGGKTDDYFVFDELFVSTKNPKMGTTDFTGRLHLAFRAPDQATVDRAYQAGLDGGGKDNGKPGTRNYHPGYYACFWLDPDGNNIEVVYHGPAKYSSKAIEITY